MRRYNTPLPLLTFPQMWTRTKEKRSKKENLIVVIVSIL